MATPLRPGVAMLRRLSSLLLCIGLVLSCSTPEVAGPPFKANQAPTAKIVTVPADSIQEGSPMTFDASTSSDPEGDSLTYIWDLGDGLSATGPVAKRSYYQLGSHAVTLIVTDQHGESDTATTLVLVVNAPPVIKRIEGPAGPIGVGNPTAIRVTASDPGSGDVLTLRIDWKDGTVDTLGYHQDQPEISSAHTYSTMGTYPVEVTAQDNDSGVTKRVIDKPIVVVAKTDPSGNRAPTAKITTPHPPGPIPEGTVVGYDATSSSDPDGDSLSYLWNWGVGSARTARSNVAAYYDEDSYEVILIVTDQHGASDTAEVDETVVNVAPTILYVVTPAGAIMVGTSSEIRFRVQDAGVKDSVTAQVDWKDGTVSTATLTPHSVLPAFNASAAHTYATPGSYAVEITARDNDGGVTKLAVDHPISAVGPHANHAPVAHITGPATGSEGEWRAFSGAGSTDPDGDSLRITCVSDDGLKRFDFGPSYPGGPCALRFPDNGTYQVSLIVRDDSGAADTVANGATHAFLWDESGMHDLGTLGHEGSEAVRINEAGTIAGTVWTKYRQSWDGPAERSADYLGSPIGALWQNRLGMLLDSTQPGPPLRVLAMNEGGDVAWTHVARTDGNFGWLWRDGNWQPLSRDRRNSFPYAINDRGDVVGTTGSHAAIWSEGSVRDLGVKACVPYSASSDCTYSAAMDINESGQVVGVSTDVSGGYHFVLWEGDTVHDLGPAALSATVVINEHGQIAGAAGDHAYFWSDGNKVTLPTLGGTMRIVGLNDNGDVVGTVFLNAAAQHVFFWSQSRGMIDLGTGPHGFGAAWVTDINARGDILGYAAPSIGYGTGEVRAIFWRNTQASATR